MPKAVVHMRTTNESHSGLSLRPALALFGLAALASLIVLTTPPDSKGQNPAALAGPPSPSEVLARLPIVFEPNRGQTTPEVHFLARTAGYTASLLSDGIALRQVSCSTATRLIFSGKRRPSIPRARNQLPGRSNYYPSSDPSTWRTGIPQYGRVEYPGVYPGIDVAVRGVGGDLEYDWIVAPGADPQKIEVRFEPAEAVHVNGEGDLIVETACGPIRQRLPFAYQDVRGQRRQVDVNYSLRSSNGVGISVGEYDNTVPLVIDPTISIAVLVGISGISQTGAGIALGQDGSIYVTGGAQVAKLSASGSNLLYSTVIGGSGTAVAVDGLGNAYITGGAGPGLAVTANAFQSNFGGSSDAFLSKLGPAGALLYSSFLGGRFNDSGTAIAVDGSGSILVAGVTTSPDFPTTSGAFRRTCAPCDGSNGEGFIAKFSNDGSTLLNATFLGGSQGDGVSGMTVDSAGNVYAAGSTRAPDFPTTPGALRTTFAGAFSDGFITKLNGSLSSLVYSTFLEGTGGSELRAIAVDSSGAAFLTGLAGSDFPLVNPLPPPVPQAPGAFIAKLSPDGSKLIYSTYLGTGGSGYAIAIDPSGAAYVTGVIYNHNPNFPLVDPIQAEINGGNCLALVGDCSDAFIVKLRPDGSGFVYSTFFGGAYGDFGNGIAADAQGNAYVTGHWERGAFPSTALSGSSGGAFILKIAPTGSTPLISARGVTNGASFQAGMTFGGIATVFGKGIVNAPGIVVASSLPLPTELNGVSVTVDGVKMPLYAIANVNGQEQINFQSPVVLGPWAVRVINNGTQAIPVTAFAKDPLPGIFTTDGSTGAIQHSSDSQLVTPSNPARRGEVLVIYATGLGRVDNDPGLGKPASASPLSRTTLVPTATIGGVAAEVQFSGLAPGFVGLNQVNVLVPQGTPSGTVNVVLTSGGSSSPAVKLAVESSVGGQAARVRRRQQ